MLRKSLTSLFLLLSVAVLAQPCRQVIGYYPSWKWYHRKFLVNPATIDYSKYSIINYAFFEPHPDGSIRPFDPLADKTLLLGELKPGAPPGYSRSIDYGHREWHKAETSLVAKAHASGTKVLISIGGWTLSEHFSSIAADSASRARFAGSCNQLIRTYGVDGIDIDWEYPGFELNKGSPADRENFTLLLKEVRDSLQQLEEEIHKLPLLTAAFGVAPSRMAFIEWEKIVPLLDYINLMTYDFYGSNHSRTNHHAPLFPPEKGLEGFNLHSVVYHLLDNYSVPKQKINIGLAFYGRSQKTDGSAGLFGTSLRVPDRETFPEGNGNPMFYSIVARQSLFDYFWDHTAQVPFLRGKNSLNTFVSFDDEYSIALKARYILHHELAGAIVWDITGDHLETYPGSGIVASTPLALVLSRELCSEDWQTLNSSFVRTADLFQLPPRWTAVESRSYPPRLLWNEKLNKKELRELKKKVKNDKRRRKKQKSDLPQRYFNGGW